MTATDDAATARLRTSHPRATVVAAAIAPDNTDQIDTRVVDGRVETTVRREDVAGLRATTQDYLRNLDAADRTVRAAVATLGLDDGESPAPGTDQDATPDDSTATETDTNTDNPTNEDTKTTDNE